MSERISADGTVYPATTRKPDEATYTEAVKTMQAHQIWLADDKDIDARWPPKEEREAKWAANKAASKVVAARHGIIYVQMDLHKYLDLGEAVYEAIYLTQQIYIYPGSGGQTDVDGYERQTVLSIEPVDFTNPDVKLLVGDNPRYTRRLGPGYCESKTAESEPV